jgi:glycosyltransferase involved in cell wall biosynthesis
MKVDDKLMRKSLDAAIELSVIKKEGFQDKIRKFDESIDLIINIKDVNLNDPKQRIDKEIILPNEVSTADKPNVCIIASDEILLEAKNLGLDTMDKDGLISLNNDEKNFVLSLADVALNPMLSGSGTNLKMLDYMAAGVPVISTAIGARGLKVPEGLISICDIDEFPEMIMMNPAEAIVSEARRFVEKNYSWKIIGKRMWETLNNSEFD